VNTNELDRRKRACGRISVKWPGHGGEQTYLLEDAAALPLLDAEPIRRVRNYHGARHSGGLYWSSTTGTHIPHESVLELQSLILLDYDRNITKISGQPLRFELRLRSSVVRHVPDFLVERNGQLEVIDVKRAEDAAGTEQAERLAATRAACASLGWGYRVMCEPEPLFFSNVQWLSAFRRPLHEPEGGAAVLALCMEPTVFSELEAQLGDGLRFRPVVFHLLWQHQLRSDLHSQCLSRDAVIERSLGER
jgi:hypothetical protein